LGRSHKVRIDDYVAIVRDAGRYSMGTTRVDDTSSRRDAHESRTTNHACGSICDCVCVLCAVTRGCVRLVRRSVRRRCSASCSVTAITNCTAVTEQRRINRPPLPKALRPRRRPQLLRGARSDRAFIDRLRFRTRRARGRGTCSERWRPGPGPCWASPVDRPVGDED
jgi:hypothetical protein